MTLKIEKPQNHLLSSANMKHDKNFLMGGLNSLTSIYDM